MRPIVRALTVPTRAVWAIECARQSWTEIDYAQRRMFELRTGISLPTARRRPPIDELETLYALKARDPEGPAA